jgi:hypothetical protein
MVCDMSVQIRELRAFAAVAEEGSLSAAARRRSQLRRSPRASFVSFLASLTQFRLAPPARYPGWLLLTKPDVVFLDDRR